MRRNIVNKNVRMVLWAHVFVVMLLCGCSSGEELFVLETSGQSLQKAGNNVPGGSGDTTGALVQEGVKGETVQVQNMKATICVHVCGAVSSPGVVEIPKGSRVQAAVAAAGGFTREADTAFVNLAALVNDGEQIYIPTKEEAKELRVLQADEKSSMVNLNTADVGQLCTLPGIGESRAGEIIAYRQAHGGFADIEEIMQIPGIKESIFQKIKDLIVVR